MTRNKEVVADLIAQLLTTDPELRLLVMDKLQAEVSESQPFMVPDDDQTEQAISNHWYENVFGLSTRTAYALWRGGISPKKMLSMNEKELLAIRGIGKSSVAEIRMQEIKHHLYTLLNPRPTLPEPT